MDTQDTWLNIFTGRSQGTFDKIMLFHNTSHQDLSTLLGGISASANTISSVTQPLAINNGVLSINLGSYSTSAQMQAAITAALASYTNTAGLNTLLAAYTNTAGTK